MKRKLYEQLAVSKAAVANCIKTGNEEWRARHAATIDALVREHMPSGSGIDSGTAFDHAASTGEKLVFNTAFHHMHDSGMYDGWTDHTVTVRASLAFGIDIRISGRNHNDIKDYLHEVFHHALTQSVDLPSA